MLRIDAETFKREIDVAIRAREARLSVFRHQLRSFHTSAYKNRHIAGARDTTSGDDPENHYFEYVSSTLPILCNGVPRIRTKSRRGGEHKQMALVMRYGLQAWMDWCRFHPVLSEAATDFLFAWSAVSVVQEERKPLMVDGLEVPQALPKVARIPQHRFLIDAGALNPQDAEWTAMLWTIQEDDLIRKATDELEDDPDCGWNLGAIKNLGTSTQPTGLHDRETRPETQELDRDEVTLYDVWVRRWEPDDGKDHDCNGGIATFAIENSTDKEGPELTLVRGPVPYYGPETGPFLLGGAFYVPNEAYPLSPLVAVEPQVRELNNVAKAVNRGIRSYKRLTLVSAESKISDERINKPDLFIVPVPGLARDEVVTFEIGGVTQQALVQLNLLRDRLSRNSGQDDAQRGSVTGEGTATEHQIAQANAATRASYIEMRWHQHVINILDAVKHFLHKDKRATFPLGEDAEIEFNQEAPWHNGGDADTGYDPADVEIRIEAGSMRQITDAIEQRRTLQAIDTIQVIVQLYLSTMGQVDGRGLASKVGDSLNMPDLDQLVNWEGLDRLLQIQTEANAQQQQQGGQQIPQEARGGNAQTVNNERAADRQAATAR